MTTPSKYMKIARAIDGNDWWVQRLQMCAEIEEIPYTRQLGILTTNGVADSIQIDEHMTVDTTEVTDTQIKNAMKTQWAKIRPTEPEPEPEN